MEQQVDLNLPIPVELILYIVACIPTTAVKDLLGVNRLLSDEAERRIYQDVKKISPEFVNAVNLRMHRARYTRSLALNPLQPTPALLAILPNFVNIHSLVLTTASRDILKTLVICEFPGLAHLEANWSLNNPRYREFLSRHPQLRSMRLHKTFSTFGMPTSVPISLLPNLTHLSAHWSVCVRLVVKGRPIRRVTMSSASVATNVPIHRLAIILPRIASAVGNSLEQITLHIEEAISDVVLLVARHLPNVPSLALVECPVIPLPFPEALRRTQLVAEALCEFCAMDEFKVNWTLPREAEKQHVNILGDALPTLRRVIFLDAAIWTRRSSESIWSRNVS